MSKKKLMVKVMTVGKTLQKIDNEQVNNESKKGDFVEVVKGQFVWYYHVVTGDEVEINCFEKHKWSVIRDHDLEC